MDGMVIPLPLQILAVVVLMGGVLGMWRACGRSAKITWLAVMLLLVGIGAIGLTMMLGAG